MGLLYILAINPDCVRKVTRSHTFGLGAPRATALLGPRVNDLKNLFLPRDGGVVGDGNSTKRWANMDGVDSGRCLQNLDFARRSCSQEQRVCPFLSPTSSVVNFQDEQQTKIPQAKVTGGEWGEINAKRPNGFRTTISSLITC